MHGAVITALPAECLLAVCDYLSVKDALAAACTCRVLSDLSKETCLWRDLAVKKWGECAADLNKDRPGLDWKRFCCKRISFVSLRKSPFQLIQEDYPDPWQHLICCALCSRTSGSELVRSTIADFFSNYPTPSAVLRGAPAALRQLLRPLGLKEVRAAAVEHVCHDFLAKDWQSPSEFHGCGRFTADSWAVFCRGLSDPAAVKDDKLRRFLAWGQQQQQEHSPPSGVLAWRRLLSTARQAVAAAALEAKHVAQSGGQQQCQASSAAERRQEVHKKVEGRRRQAHVGSGRRRSARLQRAGAQDSSGRGTTDGSQHKLTGAAEWCLFASK